jgi:hypothetical protein
MSFDFLENLPIGEPELFPICNCGCKSRMPQDCDDLTDPPYVAMFGDTDPLEIERLILDAKFWEVPEEYENLWNGSVPWELESKEDRELFHRMRYIGEFMPWMCHDPNLVRLVRESIRCENRGIRQMHMMGHASSGKTNFIILDAFMSIARFPEHSEAFVASPYKSAAEYLLWAGFNQAADRLKEHGIPVYRRQGVLSLIKNRWAGPGTITLVVFHHVGVLRGKKLTGQEKGPRGQLGVYLDEAGEFPNTTILDILANLKSQKGLRVRTGTNFRNIAGLDGRFHQPEHIPWGKLNRENDYSWEAVNGGYSVRMRALKSPNMLLGHDYYPYLLGNKEHDDLLKYGKDSPDYLAQGDAFPSIASVSRVLITESEIQGGAPYDDVDLETEEKFLFFDPSFTAHGDSAILCAGSLGYPKLGGEGRDQKIRINDLHEVHVNDFSEWTEELLEIAMRLRGSRGLKGTMSLGQPIDAFDLCALGVAQYAIDNKIPFNNIGFDDSLRGKLTAAMIYFLGEGVEGIYYGDAPTNKLAYPAEFKFVNEGKGKKRVKVRKRFDEICVNRAAQMWVCTAAMLRAGHIKNAFIAQKALDQMQLRLKAESKSKTATDAKKIALESKKNYKERNRNESPDHADAFTGLVCLIVDRKLAPLPDRGLASLRGGEQAVRSIFQMANDSGLRRAKRIDGLSR